MTFDMTDEGTLIASMPNRTDPACGPGMEVRAVRTSLDLPPTFLAEAAIFATIELCGTPQFATMAPHEREALMSPPREHPLVRDVPQRSVRAIRRCSLRALRAFRGSRAR